MTGKEVREERAEAALVHGSKFPKNIDGMATTLREPRRWTQQEIIDGLNHIFAQAYQAGRKDERENHAGSN